MASPYQKAYFLLSVADLKQLPADEGIEIAIAGRSNAGKSSVLNTLTNSKQLARVSKTPGRTQFINMFALDEERRIADLPGYGYAKVPPAMKQKWEKNLNDYFSKRKSLKGLVLVMDVRHPLKEHDIIMLAFCDKSGIPVHILLNKADKLNRGAQTQTLQAVKAALTGYRNSVTFQLFSAIKGSGVPELHSVLHQWYKF